MKRVMPTGECFCRKTTLFSFDTWTYNGEFYDSLEKLWNFGKNILFIENKLKNYDLKTIPQ